MFNFFSLLFKFLCITTIGFVLVACSTTALSPEPNADAPHKQTVHKTDDFWVALRDSYALDHYSENPEVQAQIAWFLHHKPYLEHLTAKAQPYIYYVYQQTEKRGLPAELALLPMIESAYNPFAYSSEGAAGLWQFMPVTASGFSLKEDWWYDGRRDVVASTNAALDYMTYLDKFFDGNWLLAIAAYDSGEGTVQNAVRANAKADLKTNFWSLGLPRETRDYVPRLLALAIIIGDPQKYGVHLKPIKNQPYIAQVDVGSQIDLARAAKLAGVSLKEIYQLNPGYNHWATDPDGPYQLIIPISKKQRFEKNLAKLPKSQRVTWHRYKVKSGDSLDRIANHHQTTITLLKQINKLHSDIIHPGEILLIPSNSVALHEYFLAANNHRLSTENFIPRTKRLSYTVKNGDTLWEIAKRFHITTTQIKRWNHLSQQHVLHPGEHLTLWLRVYTYDPSHDVKPSIYAVRAGDTINSIAKKLDINAQQLMALNNIHHNNLVPGLVLRLPKQKNNNAIKVKRVVYHVHAGDTLSAIAKKYHVTTASIMQWNHLKSASYIHTGQKLVIYPHA